MAIDADGVRRSLDALVAADLGRGELRASLEAVADATCELFGADGAGIMLLDEQQALHYVGATSGKAAALEAAQEQTGEGPCIDSLIHDRVVWTADLGSDPRWPKLTCDIEGLGVAAVLGVPVHLGGTAVGSLNTYRIDRYEWTDRDIAAIAAHSKVVEQLIGTAVLAGQRNTIVDQLTHALENRVTIERAVGVLMATERLDPVRAFDRLRRTARSGRRKVSEIAAEVLADPRFAPAEAPPADGKGPS